MVVLIVFVYLIFVSVILFTKKRNTKQIIKSKKRKLKYCVSVFNFFCSKHSEKYKIFNMLQQKVFTFKNQNQFNKYVLPLKNIGINYLKPIYKLEFYKKFNWQQKKKEIKLLKELSLNNLYFYTFIFVDKLEYMESIKFFLKEQNFVKDVYIYYCLDVSYKLLASINYFDVNLNNCNKMFENNKTKHLYMQNRNKSVNKASKTNFTLKKGFYLLIGTKFININFNFELNKLVFNNKTKDCEINLTKVFDYNLQQEVYRLTSISKTNKNIFFKICYFDELENINKTTHILNVFNVNNGKTCFENKNCNKTIMFSSFFTTKKIGQDGILFSRGVKLKREENITLFFIKYLNKQNFKGHLVNLEDAFNNVLYLYKDILKIKVLSYNKNINLLINNIIPNKIIQKQICCPEIINKDFSNLINLNYNESLVQKDLISVPISKFYIINDNLFKYYFNLVFYYFGAWKINDNNIILNQDKSLILQDSNVVFNVNNKSFLVKHKRENLKDEVIIDNVKYSNLKFLNCNNFLEKGKNKLEISF